MGIHPNLTEGTLKGFNRHFYGLPGAASAVVVGTRGAEGFTRRRDVFAAIQAGDALCWALSWNSQRCAGR